MSSGMNSGMNQGINPVRNPELPESVETSSEEALVPQVRLASPLEHAAMHQEFAALPVELDVAIPVRSFKVRNLLALEPGSVIETQWSNGEDMPLSAGAVQLAWSEFEVVDDQLAVRVTRLV
jgi:flagellar motor switch/type III secretory pathway protein FliN